MQSACIALLLLSTAGYIPNKLHEGLKLPVNVSSALSIYSNAEGSNTQ